MDDLELIGPEQGPQADEKVGEHRDFSGIGAALQQIQREERKVKRRDDSVASVILQYLTDEQRKHLSTLIARLVALNCPSSFILALLSLINERCLEASKEYLREASGGGEGTEPAFPTSALLPLEERYLASNKSAKLSDWLSTLHVTLSLDALKVIEALFIEAGKMEGSVLQLTAFVLQEFLRSQRKDVPLKTLQPLAASILQSLFEPFVAERQKLPEGKA